MILPLLLAQVAPAASPDVVVNALRRIRLSVSVHDGRLTDCAVRVSSGQPRVDAVACDATRTCVADGKSASDPLADCVNDAIAAFVKTRADADADAAGAKGE